MERLCPLPLLISLKLNQHWLLLVFLNLANLIGEILICDPSITSDTKHIFMQVLVTYVSPLTDCPIQSSVIFLLESWSLLSDWHTNKCKMYQILLLFTVCVFTPLTLHMYFHLNISLLNVLFLQLKGRFMHNKKCDVYIISYHLAKNKSVLNEWYLK